tara:strand:- start:5066 stop:5266 length:201 start_codon:yes stop_codon:yes gene_type:complete
MNEPFALDLTIILLLLGVGAAMLAGNVVALFRSNKKDIEIYTTRTIFLAIVGLVISVWSIASLINR